MEVEASIDTAVRQTNLIERLQTFFDSVSVNILVGQYKVNVRFVVELDGRVSNVKALTDSGYGLAKVSEKTIQRGPCWKPGKAFESIVRSYHTEPVIFVTTPEECEGDSTAASTTFL